MTDDLPIPHETGLVPAAPVPVSAQPVVLGYRAARDDTSRWGLRPRRRRSRRRRSKAGVAALAAAGLLALLATAALASALATHSRRAGGSMICTAFPLSYVAIICGIVGVIPRGRDTFHGWCALAVTALSWVVYGVAFAVTTH